MDHLQLENSLKKITKQTAAVVIELIQGGTGFIPITNDFLKKVKERCNKTGERKMCGRPCLFFEKVLCDTTSNKR